jgi:hypothetical protein
MRAGVQSPGQGLAGRPMREGRGHRSQAGAQHRRPSGRSASGYECHLATAQPTA